MPKPPRAAADPVEDVLDRARRLDRDQLGRVVAELARHLAGLAVLAVVALSGAACGETAEYSNDGTMGRWPSFSAIVFGLDVPPLAVPTRAAAAAWAAAIPACNRISIDVEDGADVENRIVWGTDDLGVAHTLVDVREGVIEHAVIVVDPRLDAQLLDEALLHEMGHALGLNHSADPNSVMFPSVHDRAELGADDVERIFSLYSCEASDRTTMR